MGGAEPGGRGEPGRGEPGAGKRIRVLYFAELRELRGTSEETVCVGAATPAELYEELGRRHGFPPPAAGMTVAVNDEIAAWDVRIADGDRLVFLTPFGGGA
jgi:molybdopterin converting factor small subunit